MLTIAVIFFSFLVLCVIFLNPKWGSFFIWLWVFAYPHLLWYEIMPLNIGVDDLFFLFLFFTVLIRRNLLGGVPIRFGYGFWMLVSFALIWTISNVSGFSYAPAYYRPFYAKEILRILVDCGLFYAILHCIDDEKDLRYQFSSFSMAAAVGAVLVILSYFFPGPMAIFASPGAIWKHGVRYEARAAGALANANMAACVLVCCLIFVIVTVRLHKSFLAKVLYYSFAFLMLLAAMVTRSRAGLLAFAGSLPLMAVFSKSRKVCLFVLLAAIIVGFFATDITRLYEERIAVAYDPATGSFGENVRARFTTWRTYFETASGRIYVFGQGAVQGHERTGGETHSVYVSLVTVYGLGGVLWALVGVAIFFKKVFRLTRMSENLASVVASGCFWSLVAWGIFATSADVISASYTRYVLFYLIVLIDRAAFLAGQQPAELPYGAGVKYDMRLLPVEGLW
jgi:hypothetical protein